jgi:hypothetical protein
LSRLKEARGFTTDVQLAAYLDVPVNTIRTWYQRGTFDWQLVVEKAGELDLNWLLKGMPQNESTTEDSALQKRLLECEVEVRTLLHVIDRLTSGNAAGPSVQAKTKSSVG